MGDPIGNASSSVWQVASFYLAGYGAVLSTWNWWKANYASYALVLSDRDLDGQGSSVSATFVNFQRATYLAELSIFVLIEGKHKCVVENCPFSFVAASGTHSVVAMASGVSSESILYAKAVGIRGKILAISVHPARGSFLKRMLLFFRLKLGF
jgi:hypothetical protein